MTPPAKGRSPLASTTGPELARAPLVVQMAKEDEVVVTYPYLVWREYLSALAMFVFLLVVSFLVAAPLLARADLTVTPDFAKAPWYFLGLQELLQRFPPVMAGVAFPIMVVIGMLAMPYLDRNPSRRPQERKVAIALFTLFVCMCLAFVVIGVFFRGPGFVWDWTKILGYQGLVP